MRSAETVLQGRKGAEAILSGEDDRLLVVVGPCSVHDVKAALEYGRLLQSKMGSVRSQMTQPLQPICWQST